MTVGERIMLYRLPDLDLRQWLSDVWRGVVVMALVIAFAAVFLAVVLTAKG
jgi:hypothetical protein